MKISHFICTLALSTLAFTACSDGPATSKSKIFGTLPSVYGQYQAEGEALKEKAKEAIANNDKGAFEKLQAEDEKLTEKYRSKIEEAAKACAEQQLEIEANEDFTVKTPVTFHFKDFFSQRDMIPNFEVQGEIVTAREILPPFSDSFVEYNMQYPDKIVANQVKLVGYDSEGNEVISNTIGHIKMQKIGDKLGFPAGTPVELDALHYGKRDSEDCAKVATLKLEIDIPKSALKQ